MARRLSIVAVLLIGMAVGYLSARGLEPTTAHFLFIPAVGLVGLVIGFVLGGRAAEDTRAGRDRAEQAKAARRGH